MTFKTAILIAALTASSPALANEFEPAMLEFIQEYVSPWANSPELVEYVVEQNQAHAGMDRARIIELDTTWRNEVGNTEAGLIGPVLDNPAAEFLREKINSSDGVIAEMFVVDNLGLNAAATGVTSDYWQGDEEKFTAVYGFGPTAVHVGEVEFDESAQAYLGQVSIPVMDTAGTMVGVLTIGINAEALF